MMRIDPINILFLLVWRPDRLIAVAYWQLTRRKLRARNRLAEAISQLPFGYQRWVRTTGLSDLAKVETSDPAERAPLAVHIHIGADDDQRLVREAIASVTNQSYRSWKLFLTSGSGYFPSIAHDHRISTVTGSFATQVEGLTAVLIALSRQDGGLKGLIIPLSAECRLPRHSLTAYAAFAAGNGQRQQLLFGDQDEAGAYGMGSNPWLKPEWDEYMFLSQDYVSQACALPALQCHSFLDDTARLPVNLFDTVLQLAARSDVDLQHIPRVTARTPKGSWQRDGADRIEALGLWANEGAVVVQREFGTTEIVWPLPAELPKVSIIVPTRDHIELLRTCIDGLLDGTDYPDLEVIVADNGSEKPETLSYLDDIALDARVRIVRWPHPFNYSAINNFAVGHATGSYLCLLNNDIEIVNPNWLTELMRHAVRPGVGAVGAKLLYPDGSIQHAGVVLGMGNAAGHAHRGLDRGEAGYFAQAYIARGATAVTAACLVLKKEDFHKAGGLDEESLAVAYNDVDLCLKLARLGLRNIYAPSSVLVHHESKSRGLDFAPENLKRYMKELAAFQERWQCSTYLDPWHHPMLDRSSEVYRGCWTNRA